MSADEGGRPVHHDVGVRLLLWESRNIQIGVPTAFVPVDGCTQPVTDMLHAFSTTVVAPAIVNSTFGPGSDVSSDHGFRSNYDAKAAALLYSDKGVVAICELAARWHGRA